jgi:hypothetical protein
VDRHGSALTTQRFVESGAISLGAGEFTVTVREMVPNERSLGQTRVEFSTRFYPSGSETTYGPYSLTERTDMRFQAREIEVRITGTADDDWRIGLPRFDLIQGGRR